MNSKLIILSLAILGIQLINASILKDEDLVLEANNVTISKSIAGDVNTAADKLKKFRDTKSFSFSKSKKLKKDGMEVPQLMCGIPPLSDEDKEICNKYQASSAVCTNDNYKKEDVPVFKCKLSGMKVTNKNVELAGAGVGCVEVDDKLKPTKYSPPCMMVYKLVKNGDYNVKDDVKAKGSGGLSTGWIVVIVIVVIAMVAGGGFFVYSKTRA